MTPPGRGGLRLCIVQRDDAGVHRLQPLQQAVREHLRRLLGQPVVGTGIARDHGDALCLQRRLERGRLLQEREPVGRRGGAEDALVDLLRGRQVGQLPGLGQAGEARVAEAVQLITTSRGASGNAACWKRS